MGMRAANGVVEVAFKRCTTLAPIVDLPEPGGPASTTTMRCWPAEPSSIRSFSDNARSVRDR